MYKVVIEKTEKHPAIDGDMVTIDTVSIDAIKPEPISSEEWLNIENGVKALATGEKNDSLTIRRSGVVYELHCAQSNIDADILAESDHYYIRKFCEEAALFHKPDSARITCVGDFYGDPEDAYIDPEERFCITVGCGIIKYNIVEPFEEYMYDIETPQWIETGRTDDIEWCTCIESVDDFYITVSCEGEDKCRFDLHTLVKESIL